MRKMGKNSSRFYLHLLNVPQLVTEVDANPIDRAAVFGKKSTMPKGDSSGRSILTGHLFKVSFKLCIFAFILFY